MVTASISMVDVNVTTKSKASEEQVFKDLEPRNNKYVTNWKVEKKLRKSTMETIQQM
jgi:hypothetical protein